MLCESHGSSQQNNLCLDDIQVPIFFPKSIFTVGLKMIFLKLFFFILISVGRIVVPMVAFPIVF